MYLLQNMTLIIYAKLATLTGAKDQNLVTCALMNCQVVISSKNQNSKKLNKTEIIKMTEFEEKVTMRFVRNEDQEPTCKNCHYRDSEYNSNDACLKCAALASDEGHGWFEKEITLVKINEEDK